MLRCPHCSANLERPTRYCSTCGSALDVSADDARTVLTAKSGSPSGGSGPATPSAAWLHSQLESGFEAGSTLGGRFRVVGLLGRGGMGDVYRADDLLLGQPVALKFLPQGLARDPDRLSRFYAEVRIARQVSHPNVCRVYDVGEIDGLPFMSMELVDGDDLASLLRRIGRLPEDKALDVARQLCAGLEAAHEKGVLHRDLKPANVLIDARGKARITDFGLAVLAGEWTAAESRAGTPAYMAPEQLERNDVSVQSDVYSLGAVLYETFTGRRAWSGNSLVEVRRQHEQSSPQSPSAILDDIDPAIERAILRCLERDPKQRPASALAVAASLPGGDPLAAALAAGELPSPDLVAAAGGAGALRPAIAWAALGVVAAGLAGYLALSGRVQLVRQVPLDTPPAVLADRAESVLRLAGYTQPAADRASGLIYNDDYLRWVRDNEHGADRWRELRTGRPAAIQFWYRQHTRHMSSKNPLDGPGVSLEDPAPIESGMVTVLLDPLGRLTDLYIVPPQLDSTRSDAAAPDWRPFFAAAGFDPERFDPCPAVWVPPVYCDARTAWVERAPEHAARPLRIEAGSYRGRPNYFQIVGAWTRPTRMQQVQVRTREKVGESIGVLLILSLLVGSVLLARRSVRSGQGDRRGATRLASWIVGLTLVLWVLVENHDANPASEFGAFVPFLSLALFLGAAYWVLYVGLEPVVRRRWPDSLISWNRLLAGRVRDPRVGRDLLIGVAAGSVDVLLHAARVLIPGWIGSSPAQPDAVQLDSLLGFRTTTALLINALTSSIFDPMAILLLLCVFRIVLRRSRVAAVVVVALVALLAGSGADEPWVAVVLIGAGLAIQVTVLVRFGLLAAICLNFVVFMLVVAYPVTSDFSVWYAPATLFAYAVLLGAALYGFRTSLGGAPAGATRRAG